MKFIDCLFGVCLLLSLTPIHAQNQLTRKQDYITPNDFRGSDTERIQAAVDSAAKATKTIVIPAFNANGANSWKVDKAILLPSDITVILENCQIQLSDSSRDNMFRSDNIIIGEKDIAWNTNIRIIGIGRVVLRGADNPRATGDAARTLVLAPQPGRVSYGSDAGRKDRKQKGDWRNIMILMAYVNGFTLQNVTIENSHAWAISFERTLNADISDIVFHLPEEQWVNGERKVVHNRDGIDLRQGCKYFRINNISGTTEDDFIALTSLGEVNPNHVIGDFHSTMITASGWYGPQDDIEEITITNIQCETNTRAVAIRAVDSAGIHHIYINGIVAKARYNSMLVGGRGYGKPSLPGRIHDIHAMNLMSTGEALILIESPIANCTFLNGIYAGPKVEPVVYSIDKSEIKNLVLQNLIRN